MSIQCNNFWRLCDPGYSPTWFQTRSSYQWARREMRGICVCLDFLSPITRLSFSAFIFHLNVTLLLVYSVHFLCQFQPEVSFRCHNTLRWTCSYSNTRVSLKYDSIGLESRHQNSSWNVSEYLKRLCVASVHFVGLQLVSILLSYNHI